VVQSRDYRPFRSGIRVSAFDLAFLFAAHTRVLDVLLFLFAAHTRHTTDVVTLDGSYRSTGRAAEVQLPEF
jgi:hypothetical protein